MSTVYIALGSNIGDKEQNLHTAIEYLQQCGRVIAVSSFLETEPMYVKDQDSFINAVIELNTQLSPQELLEICLRIEKQMGRVRIQKNGPRIVDLDILLYDELIVESEELTIPHPLMHERNFVLEPLAEIAPNVVNPVRNQTAQELLDLLG